MNKTPRTDVFLTSDEMDAGLAAFMGTSRIKAFASFARQLETELADKDRRLAEARAEIERLKNEHEDSLRRAKDNAVSLSGTVTECAGELLAKDKQLAEARAEIARLREKIKRCSTCKHYLPDNEMIEVCLNEARCCRTSARCVIDRTSSEKRASWPDLWEEDK